MTPHARRDSRRSVAPSPHSWPRPEALERRVLMAADNKAPSVEAIYVSGTQWSPEFTAYLEERNNGSSEFGFETGAGGGTKSILPWMNLDQISIEFSEDVIVDENDLEITNAAGTPYAVADFIYDPQTFTATWTLEEPLNADVLTLSLDATSPAAVTDRAGNLLRGTGGGRSATNFSQELSVLPGDVNRSGEVTEDDLDDVADRFFSDVAEARAGAGFPKYTIFHDVDASGIILAQDHSEVRKRVGTSLPA